MARSQHDPFYAQAMTRTFAFASVILFVLCLSGVAGCKSLCEKYADKAIECAAEGQAKEYAKNDRKLNIQNCKETENAHFNKCLNEKCFRFWDCIMQRGDFQK